MVAAPSDRPMKAKMEMPTPPYHAHRDSDGFASEPVQLYVSTISRAYPPFSTLWLSFLATLVTRDVLDLSTGIPYYLTIADSHCCLIEMPSCNSVQFISCWSLVFSLWTNERVEGSNEMNSTTRLGYLPGTSSLQNDGPFLNNKQSPHSVYPR